MPLVTSGTVSTTVFNTGKLIDRAFGRCKIAPQQITPEYQSIAQDLLYLFLSTLTSKGVPLWAIDELILPLYQNVQNVPCPTETIDVLNCNLRTSDRLAGTYTSSSGDADFAGDGDITTFCVQTAAAGNITLQVLSATLFNTVGFYPGVTATWNIEIQTSVDGTDWTTVYSNADLDVVEDEWFWVDIEGIPQTGVNYVRLQAGSGTTLNVGEFVVQTLPEEIPIAKINRDDYANLPDKWFPGRPVQFWYNKQIPQPFIVLWPTPQYQFTFSQIVCYTQRYIQDVGTLTQTLEIPQRWFLPIMTELARQLNIEIPEAKGDPNELAIEAKNQLDIAWGSETDSAPTYLRPRIWNYTR
jgi:hypothetical protein